MWNHAVFMWCMGISKLVVQRPKWNTDSVPKSYHNMFDDAPAKEEEYTNLTGSDILT